MDNLRLDNIRKKLIDYDSDSGMDFSRYVSKYREEDNMYLFSRTENIKPTGINATIFIIF